MTSNKYFWSRLHTKQRVKVARRKSIPLIPRNKTSYIEWVIRAAAAAGRQTRSRAVLFPPWTVVSCGNSKEFLRERRRRRRKHAVPTSSWAINISVRWQRIHQRDSSRLGLYALSSYSHVATAAASLRKETTRKNTRDSVQRIFPPHRRRQE